MERGKQAQNQGTDANRRSEATWSAAPAKLPADLDTAASKHPGLGAKSLAGWAFPLLPGRRPG